MSAPLHGTGRSRLSGDVQPAPHPSLQSFLDDHAGCHSDRGDGNTPVARSQVGGLRTMQGDGNRTTAASLPRASTVKATARPFSGAMTWREQAGAYPERGVPGIGIHSINHFRAVVLAYDERRLLVGILRYYFRDDVGGRKGEVIVWVRPSRRRRGHGTRLIAFAAAKWGYDPTAQHFTPLGALFHEGRLAKRS